MNRPQLAILLIASSLSVMAQAPAGWKTLKSAAGDCQMSVPADWTISPRFPGRASAPGNVGRADLSFRANVSVAPMGEAAQKVTGVDKMFSNSPKLVFFSLKPMAQASPLTPYSVQTPGKGGMCAALIPVRSGISEDTVKKIAATLR